MLKYSRYSILLAPILIFFSLELMFFRASLVYFSLIFANFVIVLSFFLNIKERPEVKLSKNFLIFPILFLNSAVLYALICPAAWMAQILFLLIVFTLYLYYKNNYYYLMYGGKESGRLENISSFGNFLILFFLSAGIYGLRSFLNIPIWVLTLVVLPFLFLIIYQVFWINKAFNKERLFFVLLGCLLLIELLWTISFLPFSFNVLGLILAICYYMFIGITRFYLRESLNSSIIKRYLIFGFLSILIILLSAKI